MVTCGDAEDILQWTQTRSTMLQKMDPLRLFFPNFSLWSRPNNNATIWILGHVAYCTLQHCQSLSTTDYIDYLGRVRWKNFHWSKRRQTYGNYLDICLFSMAQQPLVGHGLLIIKASRSHSDTPHSLGLLWTSDQTDAETSTWQHTTLTGDRHPCPPAGFEPTSPAANDRRPTP
jgi:hypothetical protein